MFRKGLPHCGALSRSIITVCPNTIAWKISALDENRLCKPIDAKVKELLDDLKIFATSESKLPCLIKSVKAAMKNEEWQWNPKRCAVTHIRRGVLVTYSTGVKDDGNAKISILEEGQQYNLLGVLKCLRQEGNLALKCAAKKYSRKMSLITSSPFSECHRMIASTQFAKLAINYFMWTQHSLITEQRGKERDALKIVAENGGKHPFGLTSLLYLFQDKGGKGLHSIEREYKEKFCSSPVFSEQRPGVEDGV